MILSIVKYFINTDQAAKFAPYLKMICKTMNADEKAKLAYQLILFTNKFFDMLLEQEKKFLPYHINKGVASEVVENG